MGVGVLKELIGVAASPALLSLCTDLLKCSAITACSSHMALLDVHLHFNSLTCSACQCGQVNTLALVGCWLADVNITEPTWACWPLPEVLINKAH